MTLTAILGLLTGAPAEASDGVPAAVVVIGDLSPQGVVEAAQAQRPALWRLEPLARKSAPPAPGPQAEIQHLGRVYTDADFLSCLTELKNPALDFNRLLEQRRRVDAARVGTFAAACALGAGDEARARELVRRLLARELDDPDVLRRTTPAFQALAEDERQKSLRWGRVNVDVRTTPEGAAVLVDGAARCPGSPCRLNLLRGEHLFVAERVGYQPRVIPVLLENDQTVTLVLDAAAAEQARQQLQTTMGAGTDPSCIDMARTASTAFGVGLVVLTWQREGQVHANVFDRGADTLTHVALQAEPGAAARAVTAALSESHVNIARQAWWRRAFSWTMVLGVALLSAAVVFLFSRRRGQSRDIVFR